MWNIEKSDDKREQEVLQEFQKLLDGMVPIPTEEDREFIREAFYFAWNAHKGVNRKSGEPYIFHPIAVASICSEEMGLRCTSVASALLHDVVEDTDYTLEDIENKFGKEIAVIIDGLTKIKGVFKYGTSEQAENFRKLLFTLVDDIRVVFIKLADRLHNMRTLDSMPRDKQLKIANETIYLYAPFAHRLGFYSIKSELEDLYLKYSEEESYNKIKRKVSKTKKKRKKIIERFTQPIIEKLDKDKVILDYEIKGRTKSIHSIWQKMKKQNVDFEQVYDLFAIRIILKKVFEGEEKAACWQVFSIITDIYRPSPARMRDWISIPRANGYESLHTTVMNADGQWVEVQIRTERMDDIAEKGYAAHWKYKESKEKKSSLDRWLTKFRKDLESKEKDSIEFIDGVKGDHLYDDEIVVFTPQGDLITLPKNATVLDFAFDIHTEIGMQCQGAKIENKLVSISGKLKNGDRVEIITTKQQKPKEDWLNWVVTSKARSSIKESLRKKRKEIVAHGKEIVERKLKQLKMDITQQNVELIVAHFEFSSIPDLYYAVGKGEIDHSQIKSFQFALASTTITSNSKIQRSENSKDVEIHPTSKDTLLIGDDMNKIDYVLSPCCNPIPGDNVFGYVTSGKGVKIHRTTCTNTPELLAKHGHRVMKAGWKSSLEDSFSAKIELSGVNRTNLMKDISRVLFLELKINIKSVNIGAGGEGFSGEIEILVRDTQRISVLIDKLQKIDGVVNVSRLGEE